MRRKGTFMTEVLETLLANRERVRIRLVERGELDYLHIKSYSASGKGAQGGSDN